MKIELTDEQCGLLIHIIEEDLTRKETLHKVGFLNGIEVAQREQLLVILDKTTADNADKGNQRYMCGYHHVTWWERPNQKLGCPKCEEENEIRKQ